MTEQKSTMKRRAIAVTAAATFMCFAGVYPQFQLAPIQGLVQEAANLTAAQYTRAFTAPNIPGVLFSLVSGILIDRFGHRRMIALALALGAVGAFGRLACGSYLPFLIAMALTGLTPTFAMSNSAKIMSHYAPKERLNVNIAIMMLGASLASFIGASTSHLYPSAHSAFWVAGSLAVAALVVWLLCVRGKAHGGGAETAAAAEEKISIRAALRSVVSSGRIWRLGICMVFLQTMYITISSSAPSALRSVGYSAGQAGLIAGMLSIGSPLGSLFGSSLALRSKNPKRFLNILTAVTALVFPLLWSSKIMAVSIAAFMLAGFCYSTTKITVFSMPIRFSEVGQKYAGTAGGLINMMQNLGGFFLPAYVVVPLAGGNYHRMFLLIGVAAGLGCLCTFLIPRLPRSQQSEA